MKRIFEENNVFLLYHSTLVACFLPLCLCCYLLQCSLLEPKLLPPSVGLHGGRLQGSSAFVLEKR